MLTPVELELLTAAVDGELDARQQRRLTRLLACSTEARQTLQGLQRDAAAVRDLPHRACPVDLIGSVLNAVAHLPRKTSQPRRPSPLPRLPEPVGVPAGYALALAASVLLVIGVASYVYFAISGPREPGPSNPNPPNLARIIPPRPIPQPAPRPDPVVPGEYKAGPDQGTPELGPALVKQPKPPEPVRPPLVPEPPTGPIFTGPSGEKIELKTIEPTALTLHRIQGLKRGRFLGELGKARAFRLELPARDTGKVIERLQYAFKSQNIAATVGPIAAARLAKSAQWRTSYLLVLEDITPEELANLLTTLAEADRKGEPRKGNEPTTPPVLPGKLVLSRLNKNDQRDLNDHLGTELLFQSSKATGPLGVDPTRPLADQTAEEIERHLGAPGARPALLLAYGLPKQLTPSAEVKKYLLARKPARPGTIQVMLVVRHVG